MSTLRRLLSPLAALLAVLVVVQTTDLVACADEAEVAEHAGDAHDHGTVVQGAHLVPAPGGDHDDEPDHDHDGVLADCLCHVVFAPTASFPTVAGRPAPVPAEVAFVLGTPPDVAPSGVDHVPLG